MTAVVILAAGSSSRLGEPKQTLIYDGKTLIQHAVEAAMVSKCRPVIAVVGANHELVSSYIPHQDVHIILNNEWSEGMASSIKAAVNYMLHDFDIDSALFILCDQPYVNHKLLDAMLQAKQESEKAIVACAYGGTVGVPVLFDRSMFNHLLLLQGDEGAKNILKTHPEEVVTIPFDKGVIDIDTQDDYNNLLSPDN
ncbi:nucleotidyltransferase family protein [Mucilaginibacter terrenus]|uniref:Nucleotidyltransferase family protein n=1 Tax=Mucilaginibacter terrenus TaxID=2482727 RepID=A0A3E2NXI7_9SPHI|nr:nucleotidyltransferase family protein [Mucilaginibacter terrenus]RFZ85728.1 nucleotidyltransferase family protein [Mucilaginibacter terrenus]